MDGRIVVDGDAGEAGRLKGDERGDVMESGNDLCVDEID